MSCRFQSLQTLLMIVVPVGLQYATEDSYYNSKEVKSIGTFVLACVSFQVFFTTIGRIDTACKMPTISASNLKRKNNIRNKHFV